jgi:hypothetical protein
MCEHHAASLGPRPEKVQSFFMRSFARRNPPHSDESAVPVSPTTSGGMVSAGPIKVLAAGCQTDGTPNPPGHSPEYVRALNIHYVVVDGETLKITGLTLEDWLRSRDAEWVSQIVFNFRWGLPPGHVYLAHLR